MNMLLKRIGALVDHWYLGLMVCIAPLVVYLNWYALGMAGLLPGYKHFKLIIQSAFQHPDLITFPMWGYGWLMLITENKLLMLFIQLGTALLAFWYFVRFLEQEKLFSPSLIRALKICMIVSLPWYAFHALRWPYSIASSLFLIAVVLLCKALTHSEISWERLVGSAFCFGLLLNFRSDYWLMPLGFAFLIIVFFRTKKATIQAGVWFLSIYACLIPWAIYTKKACGHYLVTSTNSGHVMFIGLGNDPDNMWGIEGHDGDPLMHRIVDEHFKKHKHSTLDYEADQFLKKTFFQYIKTYPWSYLKKVIRTFFTFITDGFYPGEFFLNEQGETPLLKNTRIRHLLTRILCNPHFVITNSVDTMRIFCTAFSQAMGVGLLFLSYLTLPLTIYTVYFRKRVLLMMLILAAIAYQTLLNTLCFHMSGYTSNLYVVYLLNMIYGVSLAYGFASDWYHAKCRRLRFVPESRG